MFVAVWWWWVIGSGGGELATIMDWLGFACDCGVGLNRWLLF